MEKKKSALVTNKGKHQKQERLNFFTRQKAVCVEKAHPPTFQRSKTCKAEQPMFKRTLKEEGEAC